MHAAQILGWFRLRDLDEAIQRARIAVIKRYARGNVTFQNGNVLDDEALERLTHEGDRALAELCSQQERADPSHDRGN